VPVEEVRKFAGVGSGVARKEALERKLARRSILHKNPTSKQEIREKITVR
jgi:hypothetical protein